jgi:hypothetical protein
VEPPTRIDPALIAAYRAAHYEVSTDASAGLAAAFVLRVDVASSELLALYGRHGVSQAAYLTACNPHSTMLSDADNRARMDELAQTLRALARQGPARSKTRSILRSPAHAYVRSNPRSYMCLHGRGTDPSGAWPGEASVLVLGMSEEQARELGTRFAQNALLHAGADGVPRLVLLR